LGTIIGDLFTYKTTPLSLKHCIIYTKTVFLAVFLFAGCTEEVTPPEKEPEVAVKNDPSVGCTDTIAKNYKSTAITEDCSCEYDFNSQIATTTPSSFLRRALIEEHTGTWCGWCPMANEVMEDLTKNPQVIGVGIHYNDEMADLDVAHSPLRKKYGGVPFPSGMVNRRKSVLGSTVIQSHEDWKINAEEWLKQGNTSVGIALESTLKGDEFTLLSHLKFTEKSSEKLRMGVYLVEDKVAGYPQLNYLSNYQQFKQWKAFSQPVEITDILHYNVARAAIIPITEGVEIPPAALADGKVFRKLFQLKLPESVDVPSNVKAIVFIMNEALEILTVREVAVNQQSDWE
jgi:thiol-disulfide isomerase/thioredoxin